jgi:aldehyde:ferredoxin oxidoreductase
VERGRYLPEALRYRMSVKGLFQSDPHDSRILKAFALGLAVATRGMDHLRNRVTLEINARINDDPEFKTSLYGGRVAAQPDSYDGKEYAVRRCEDTFAVGDAVGMCRFNTQLFNSPSLPGCEAFAVQLNELLDMQWSADELLEIGRNITGLERMINARLGLGSADDTLPRRWFEEENSAGPFQGERIDRNAFEALKQSFYDISGLDANGLPKLVWWRELAHVVTGFTVTVKLPELGDKVPRQLVVDQPLANIAELRDFLGRMLQDNVGYLQDPSLGVAVNGELVMTGEASATLRDGDEIELVPVIAGG